MIPLQQVIALIASLGTFALVIEMLRRRRLRERHAGWWLFAGGIAILLSIFPGVLTWVANLLGFEMPVNLVFFFSLFILFLVALQNSSELTKLEDHNRKLVERLVLMELKLDQILEARSDQG